VKLYPMSGAPYVYLSGGHSVGEPKEERAWLKKTGCKYRCYSFAYTCEDAPFFHKRLSGSLDTSIKAGVGIMMDSGAHTFHKMRKSAGGTISSSRKQHFSHIEKLKGEWMKTYAKYCRENMHLWDWAVTFDYVKHCPEIFRVTELLEKDIKAKLVPVFHGDQSTVWLERYADSGHKLVGLGSVPRAGWKGMEYYYGKCFDVAEKVGLKLHGFAVTSLSLMFRFPWYSVDSATWVKVAAYGKIIVIDPVRNVVNQIHVSDRASTFSSSYNHMPKTIRRMLRTQVEADGFDFDEVRSDLIERGAYNAFQFCHKIPQLKESVAREKVQWESLL
jgi:hypothetical protein